MPLYSSSHEHTNKRLLFFCGDDYEWDQLIIKNCKATKDVYLCDSTAPRKYYPSEIKVIRSELTARRTIAGFDLSKATIFVKDKNVVSKVTFENVFFKAKYFIAKAPLQYILKLLKEGEIEPFSSKNIRYLKKYR